MQRKSLLICMLLVACGMVYATTATKGFFSVSASKKVQFADANSVYSDNELIQWANVADVITSGWDVLTSDEWTYLLVTRDGEGMSKNALGTVNGVNGLIILPDGWVQPEGVPVYQEVATGIGYEENVFNAAQWSVMENAGAVFLPCRGYGYGSGSGYKEEDTDDHGSYWAKNASDASNAYRIQFNIDNIHDCNTMAKSYYYSVRLVKEVPTLTVLDEDDESATFETKLTAAKTHDYAVMQRTMLRNGYFNTLCLPFDVPNIDASPLAGAEVYTFDGGTVSGTPGHEILHFNLTSLSGQRLSQGVPYLIRWTNATGTLDSLYFYNVENWDTNTSAGDDAGNASIKMHGFYYKTHITGSSDPSAAHYNFFLGNNNAINWPTDGGDATKKMKGFRAHFYTSPGGSASSAPLRRNMTTVWDIDETGSATAIQNTPSTISSEKLFRDGRAILHINGHLYDMSGKRLNDQ